MSSPAPTITNWRWETRDASTSRQNGQWLARRQLARPFAALREASNRTWEIGASAAGIDMSATAEALSAEVLLPSPLSEAAAAAFARPGVNAVAVAVAETNASMNAVRTASVS